MPDEQRIRAIVRQEISKSDSASRFQMTMTSHHVHNDVDAPKIPAENIIPGIRASGSITFAQSTNYQLGIIFNPSAVLFYGAAFRTDYTFTVTAANATRGAIYTNNGKTFTVMNTIAGATTLTMTGSGDPAASGTLTKSSGTGDATITFSTFSSGFGIRAQLIGNAQLGPSYYFQPQTSTSVQIGGQVQNVIQSSNMFLIDSSTSPVTVRDVVDEGHLIDVEYSTFGIVARATITDFDSDSISIQTSLAQGWTIVGNYVVT